MPLTPAPKHVKSGSNRAIFCVGLLLVSVILWSFAFQKPWIAHIFHPLGFNKAVKKHSETDPIGKSEYALPAIINTAWPEIKPVISPDGKTLYFSRLFYPGNIGGPNDEQDIYFTQWRGDSWTYPENIDWPLNNKYPNGVASIAPDGMSMLVINNYDRSVDYEVGASISFKTHQGWSFPKPLKVKEYYNQSKYSDFYLGGNGTVLLMAIQRKDSHGDQDVYVSFPEGEREWSSPYNLGSIINSKGAEFSPFLAADHRTLFFASTGHKGFGKSDIFYAKRLDETWSNWTTPVNLGQAYNSKGWDAYFSITASGDHAYFVGSGGSNKGEDRNIYKAPLSEKFKPDPVVWVKGKVYDVKTQRHLKATISIKNLSEPQTRGKARSNGIDGCYKIILNRETQYQLTARSAGYLPSEVILQDLGGAEDEITKNIALHSVIDGEMLALQPILFARGEAVLLAKAYTSLDRLVELMRQNRSWVVEIGGHTDNLGFIKAKFSLSERRALVVKEYLERHGVGANRMRIKAYGDSRPVASNGEEETRQMNRRVEVKILEK